MTLRIGVLLSGSGTTMINIQDRIDSGYLDAEIVVVVSSRTHVKGNDRAKEAGYPLHVLPAKDYKGDVPGYSQAITAALDSAKPDLVVMAGFMSLFEIPPHYDNKVMNIHPSLIPKFCGHGFYGMHVHRAVVEAKETESGCTVHFANNQYDEGPIILQKKVPVHPDDTAEDVAARVKTVEDEAYPEAIKMFIDGAVG